MFPFFIFLRKIRRKLKNAFYGTIISTIVVVLYGTFSEYYLENPYAASGIHSLFESFWWVVQTITTVGYGDVPVVSYLGKVNAVAIMLFGIGSLGIFTASVAANLVELNVAEKLGEVRIKMKDHVIVCNTDERLSDLIGELNESGVEVVVMDSEDPKMTKGDYTFVKGSCSIDEDLQRAGLKGASKVVVLPEKNLLDPSSSDAKSILTAMIIKKMKPDAYVILELLRHENAEHARIAGADEIVIKGALSLLLLASSVTSPGVSKLFYNLLTGDNGHRVKEYDISDRFKRKKCGDLYREMEYGGRVVIGFRSRDEIRIRPTVESEVIWDTVVVIEPKTV